MEIAWIDHIREIERCLYSVADSLLLDAAQTLASAPLVLTAGNGGSHALASHAAQALMKPNYAAGGGVPAACISDGVPTLTAHANDGGWGNALVELVQPFIYLRPTMLLISSSGKSENIVRVAELAIKNNLRVVSFTGFGGEPLRGLATISIHVDSTNYEVVEPVHDVILHRIQGHLRNRK